MTFIPRQTGRSQPGSLRPTTGLPAMVTARGAAWGSVVSWTGIGGASRYAVYVDGRLVTTTSSTEVVIPSLTETMNIAVVAVGDTVTPSYYRPEWEEGDQAFLSWGEVTDTTLAAYVVDGPDGTTTVSTVTIPEGVITRSSGSGAGRLRTGGRFVGSPINDVITITVDATQINYEIGDLTGSFAIAKDETALLPYGATITFLDDPSAYTDGDIFELSLRIDAYRVTAGLARGTHTFQISSVTSQGVEGTPVTSSVFVPSPDVSVVATLGQNESDEVVCTYTLSGDNAAGIALFTNVDVDGSLMSFVDEVSPTSVQMTTSGDLSLPVDISSVGTLTAFVGIVTTWGHIVRQLEPLTLQLPVPPAVLGIPEIISAVQVGTAIEVTFSYTASENDSATAIRVTRSGDNIFTDDIPVTPGLAGTSLSGSVTIDGTDPDGAQVTITALATDGTNDGEKSDPVTITLDLHEPDAPTSSWGAPV